MKLKYTSQKGYNSPITGKTKSLYRQFPAIYDSFQGHVLNTLLSASRHLLVQSQQWKN